MSWFKTRKAYFDSKYRCHYKLDTIVKLIVTCTIMYGHISKRMLQATIQLFTDSKHFRYSFT